MAAGKGDKAMDADAVVRPVVIDTLIVGEDGRDDPRSLDGLARFIRENEDHLPHLRRPDLFRRVFHEPCFGGLVDLARRDGSGRRSGRCYD